MGKTVLRRPVRRSRRLQKRTRNSSTRAASPPSLTSSSSSSDTSSSSSTSNTSSTSSSSEDEADKSGDEDEQFFDATELQTDTNPDSPPVTSDLQLPEPVQESETVALQPDPEEIDVVTPEAVHSETVRDSSDSETQTAVTSRADAVSQTTETAYPNFWDDDGLIGRELRVLRSLIKSFAQRMASLRSHGEARSEINRLTDGLRNFLTFHRRQITRYVENVVMEGHRAPVKDELRTSSNQCIMPVLSLMDKFRARNETLSRGGQLSGYRDLLQELEDTQGHVELVRFIEPCQLLN